MSPAAEQAARDTVIPGECQEAGGIPPNLAAHCKRPPYSTNCELDAKFRSPLASHLPDRIGMPTLEESPFVESLRRSELLPEERLAEILRRAGPNAAPEALAKALVDRKFITTFQAEELERGNHRRLRVAGYVIQEPLGWGGMGTVFRAVQTETGRSVALKILSDRFRHDAGMRARFRLEAKAGKQFHHPNLIETYDSGTTEEVFGQTDYVALESFEGITLQELVGLAGKLPYGAACDMISQAALGVHEINQLGMVHRDIKPDNILVDREGRIKVVDFGLTLADQLSYDEEFSLSMIFGHDCLGTCDYMAPEQAVDSLHVDARADVYSLGCTLYAILAARRVYNQPTAATVIEAHRTQPIPDISQVVPGIPAALSNLITRMMAKSAKDRPASMLQVVQALAPFARRKAVPFEYSEVVKDRREKAKLRGLQVSLAGSMPARRSSAARLSTAVNQGPTKVENARPDRKPDPLVGSGEHIVTSIPVQRPAKRAHVPEEQRLLLVFDNGEQILIRHTETLIGRANDCQIQLDDPELALHHCQLEFDGKKWILTSVGGVPLLSNGESRKTTLPKVGDNIGLSAKTRFEIRRPRMGWPGWAWLALGLVAVVVVTVLARIWM